MPNWCECDLWISGNVGDLNKLIDTVRTPAEGDKPECVLDTEKIIPYPEEFRLLDEVQRGWEAAADKLRAQGKEPETPRPKDGFNSGGYEWCRQNWGTKWGICDPARIPRKRGLEPLSLRNWRKCFRG